MKLSDYVFNYLAKLGIKHIFMIVGGANANLADSLAKNKKLKHICTIQEQGAAMAGESYARITGNMAAVLVTSGPGGTNAITGLNGAWCDSAPVIFISGQVTRAQMTDGKTIRQLGVQQINIIEQVKPVTKYAAMITEPDTIRYHLEKAAWLAKNSRPGPVWLDIPTDVQHAEINPDKIKRFEPKKEKQINEVVAAGIPFVKEKINKALKLIKKAKRPVVILGHGIRISHGEKEMAGVIGKLGFPVITTWNGVDLISHSHPLYIGHAGAIGERGANFAVANSDLILAIGSRMDTRQVGNNGKLYATAAKKIVVDIDRHELGKGLIGIDVPVKADARVFLKEFLSALKNFKSRDISEWVLRCRQWKEKYPMVLPEYFKKDKPVNSYVFIDALSDALKEGETIITDMGTSLTCTMQTFKIKKNQRLFTNTGFASMGFGLPGTIGAWYGSGGNKKRIIGVYGDGGFQMNIQELQTVKHYKIPIKIFLLNNKSYLTIKNTQRFFFGGKITASDPASGYSVPNFIKIARAYGFDTEVISNHKDMRRKIHSVINRPGPVLCEIEMDQDQELIPISVYKKVNGKFIASGIEQMYPYLPDKEFNENMMIKPRASF